ncbi:MAG: cache domain-containing protein [Candidatus Sumerlaeia bacterium]|nr:cache domain-containing protein [Candidatus Sumerlaeia bacterium]
MIRSSIRAKLITAFTVAAFVQGAITCLVGMQLFYNQMLTRAQSEVSAALNSAREIYANHLREVKDTVRMSATRRRIIEAMAHSDRSMLAAELERVFRDERLDFLAATDAGGRVVCRAQNPSVFGDSCASDTLIRAVLQEQKPVAATVILPRERLLSESPALAERACIRFVEIPGAKPREGTSETAGMVLGAAAPVLDESGRLVGMLYGGTLLNRNYTIVDKIKETVFLQQTYKGREVGTATLFQGDLRISTNVRNPADGSRAIGTRLWSKVYDVVLNEGRPWIDEAFVVSDWYITAYEPIRDLAGRIIGILYVGMLKQPFVDNLWKTISVFVGIALLGITLVIVIAVVISETLTRPLRKMAALARTVADGNYEVEIKVESRDEIGQLAESFNTMTARLSEVLGELREWARTLEAKVEQRSHEIQAMQSQLMQSEKLASLGKLAAGVAHEINNPMTGILTNASLMLEDLPEADPRREDLQTIVNETIRCRRIVKGLLDFARQSKPEKKNISVNDSLRNALNLLRNQASFRNIEIIENLDPYLPEISADPNQLQQVFVNILINASEAMPNGGQIQVVSRRADRTGGQIEVSIADTGPGISPEVRSKLFDPFFTTKSTGTGLGLAVSYGIVESHGGTIEVQSEPGLGATFIIRLPSAEK